MKKNLEYIILPCIMLSIILIPMLATWKYDLAIGVFGAILLFPFQSNIWARTLEHFSSEQEQQIAICKKLSDIIEKICAASLVGGMLAHSQNANSYVTYSSVFLFLCALLSMYKIQKIILEKANVKNPKEDV